MQPALFHVGFSAPELILNTAKYTAQVMVRGGGALFDIIAAHGENPALENDLIFSILSALDEEGLDTAQIVNFYKDGATPLHLAAMQNNVILAQLLLNHGANISALNYEGRKAADVAFNAASNQCGQYLHWLEGERFEECDSFLMSLPDRYDIHGEYLRDLKASILAGYDQHEVELVGELPSNEVDATLSHPAVVTEEVIVAVSSGVPLEMTEVPELVASEPALSSYAAVVVAPVDRVEEAVDVAAVRGGAGSGGIPNTGSRRNRVVMAMAAPVKGSFGGAGSATPEDILPKLSAVDAELKDRFKKIAASNDYDGVKDMLRSLSIAQAKSLVKELGGNIILDLLNKIKQDPESNTAPAEPDSVKIIQCLKFYGATLSRGFLRSVEEIEEINPEISANLGIVGLLERDENLRHLNARRLVFAVKNDMNNLVEDLSSNKKAMKEAIEYAFQIYRDGSQFDIAKMFHQISDQGYNLFKEGDAGSPDSKFGIMFLLSIIALEKNPQDKELLSKSCRALFEIDGEKLFLSLTTKYRTAEGGSSLKHEERSDGKTLLQFLADKKLLSHFTEYFDNEVLSYQYEGGSFAAHAIDNNFKALLITLRIRGIDLSADEAVARIPDRMRRLNELMPPRTAVPIAVAEKPVGDVLVGQEGLFVSPK